MTMEDNDDSKRKSTSSGNAQGNVQFGGLLDGMANLIGKLGELAEKGQELKRSGQFESDDRRTVAGSYGFSVKFGPGGTRDDAMKVAPVDTGKKPTKTSSRPECREPHVDVFEEPDHVLVIAEMPGVPVEQVELDFEQTQMTLIGNSPRVRFEKRIELGSAFEPSDVTTSINNGIVEIKLVRRDLESDPNGGVDSHSTSPMHDNEKADDRPES